MSFFSILEMLVQKKPPTCSAVIAAAGSSRRCKGEDKLCYEINGKPVLAYTVEAFEKCPVVREIIIATREENMGLVADMCSCRNYKKVTKVIAGGNTRTESVYNAVFSVSDKVKYIAIHDGARPLIDASLIEATLMAAVKYHAAAPGVPVSSTIKKVDMTAVRDCAMPVLATVDRRDLYEIQTPQIFKAQIIKAGLAKAVRETAVLTDDCMAVERIGVPVYVTQGSKRNIKLTEHGDLLIAEALLK